MLEYSSELGEESTNVILIIYWVFYNQHLVMLLVDFVNSDMKVTILEELAQFLSLIFEKL